MDDIPKAVEASNKIAEALQRHPPPAPGNELAWIEWGKQLTSTRSFNFTKENDYHRPLDAEMKWLYTLLFDQGVQASLKARLSKMSTEWMVILYLYVTQAPCNFCVQMLLLHHPKLKAIQTSKCSRCMWPRLNTERVQVQAMDSSLRQKGRKSILFLTGTQLGHLYLLSCRQCCTYAFDD